MTAPVLVSREDVARARAAFSAPAEPSATARAKLTAPSDMPAPRPFPTVRVLEGEPPPPPSMQVDELLLDGDINLNAGHGGAAKTVIGLTTAAAVSIGHPVFGTKIVHRPGPVLLLLPEDGVAVARMILDAIVEGMALSPNDRATLTERLVMVPDSEIVNITSDADLRRLSRTATDHEAVMVYADPLSNLIGDADENAPGVAGSCCDMVRRTLCRGAGVRVLWNHHNRKPGKDAADATATVHDIRGGGGWVNHARLVFGVSKKGGRVTMNGLKANRIRTDLRHDLDLVIEADPQNQARWLTCRLTDANMGAASESLTPGIGRSLNVNETAVLSALEDRHEPDRRLSWSQWFKLSGITSENTFKTVRTRVLDAHLAMAVATGRKTRTGTTEYHYTITPEGRSALGTGWINERPNGETVSKRC